MASFISFEGEIAVPVLLETLRSWFGCGVKLHFVSRWSILDDQDLRCGSLLGIQVQIQKSCSCHKRQCSDKVLVLILLKIFLGLNPSNWRRKSWKQRRLKIWRTCKQPQSKPWRRWMVSGEFSAPPSSFKDWRDEATSLQTCTWSLSLSYGLHLGHNIICACL